MNNFLEKIRSFLATLGTKLKRKPKDIPAVSEPITAPRTQPKRIADRFTIISWAVTLFVVVALLGSTIFYKNSHSTTYVPVAQPINPASGSSGSGQPQVSAPTGGGGGSGVSSIARKLQLKTNIPERPRYESVLYRVSRGDAMLSIAEDYDLKSETLLYVNTQLEDNPHNLKPGMELTIPPVDGLFYTWKEGDTFETVAEKFDTTADEIINFPGNKVDLTDPKIEIGTTVMIPGGSRELRNWEQDLATNGRGVNTGTGEIGGNACGGGTHVGAHSVAHAHAGRGSHNDPEGGAHAGAHAHAGGEERPYPASGDHAGRSLARASARPADRQPLRSGR
jgi:LysM repeat protein